MNEARVRHTSTFERAFALVSATVALSAFVAVRQINPSSSSIFPVCPFHAMTGLNCPGCGATRGMHALLNGDILTAMHFNAMLVVFVPLIIYGIVSLILLGIRGKGLPAPQLAPQGVWAFLILMVAFGVLRNLPFYPFSLLAI
jgi:hypothetical protein